MEEFYTGVNSHFHLQCVSKVSIYLNIPIIGRVITIWDELFFILRVSFYELVRNNKVLLDSSHRIETHLGVVVEFLEVGISVTFEFFLDEEFVGI